MAVRKVLRAAVGTVPTIPTGGPNWNSIRVDPTTNVLMVGSGASGTAEFPAVGNTPVLSSQAAATTLLASQSGSTCLFDSTASIVYTLPAPTPGIWFNFVSTVTITTNSNKVITSAGTVFIQGTMVGVNTASADALLAFSAVSTTTISVLMPSAGSQPAGGIIGTQFMLECVSATLWQVTGLAMAGTTFTTPFSNT